ncbi:hypothetical protein D3C86_1310390 [compost metagenome]
MYCLLFWNTWHLLLGGDDQQSQHEHQVGPGCGSHSSLHLFLLHRQGRVFPEPWQCDRILAPMRRGDCYMHADRKARCAYGRFRAGLPERSLHDIAPIPVHPAALLAGIWKLFHACVCRLPGICGRPERLFPLALAIYRCSINHHWSRVIFFTAERYPSTKVSF